MLNKCRIKLSTLKIEKVDEIEVIKKKEEKDINQEIEDIKENSKRFTAFMKEKEKESNDTYKKELEKIKLKKDKLKKLITSITED